MIKVTTLRSELSTKTHTAAFLGAQYPLKSLTSSGTPLAFVLSVGQFRQEAETRMAARDFQRTLKTKIEINGVGLHSGRTIQLVLHPAGENSGVRFRRSDLPASAEIPAFVGNVVSTQMATVLGHGDVRVSTVEHLMAALAGLGIDNLLVEVSGPEIPILDGSALPFVRAIQEAGIVRQMSRRKKLVLRKKVQVKIQEKWATVEPSSKLEIHGSIEWDHPSIGYQEYHYVEGKEAFENIALARTFGFMKDVEALQKMGLAKGGSFANAVVLDHALVLNPEGLRTPDEFVRHKVLDALGDFMLSGFAIQGYFRLHRAGHDVHRLLLAEIFKNPDNYEIVGDEDLDHRSFSERASALIGMGATQTNLAPGAA